MQTAYGLHPWRHNALWRCCMQRLTNRSLSGAIALLLLVAAVPPASAQVGPVSTGNAPPVNAPTTVNLNPSSPTVSGSASTSPNVTSQPSVHISSPSTGMSATTSASPSGASAAATAPQPATTQPALAAVADSTQPAPVVTAPSTVDANVTPPDPSQHVTTTHAAA